MKTPGKSGKVRAPSAPSRSEDTALYQLSRILNDKTDGSLIRRMPFKITQKTTEDVDNGHSKECRVFDVDLHCNTFKIRFRAVYTQANGGACRRNRTRHAAAKREHHRLFFGRRERGVRPHPPNPPWLRACKQWCTYFTCGSFQLRIVVRLRSYVGSLNLPVARRRLRRREPRRRIRDHWDDRWRLRRRRTTSRTRRWNG